MDIAWGYHLLIDCKAGNINQITSKENISDFVKELVDKIDMIAYGDLMIERFATHDPSKAGISFCQMIETSNITGHFVDLNGDFYIDIFSCKEYSTEAVLEMVTEYFTPTEIAHTYVLRGKK